MIGIAQPRRGPGKAAGHILHHHGDRDDQTGDETAARLVMAAQEDVETHHQHHRHDHAGHHHHHHRVPVARARLVGLAVQQTRAHRAREQRLGQRVDQQGGNAQHDDLTIGVETAEIDEDHVHHIGTAATLVGVGKVEFGNARRHGVAQQVVIGQRHGRRPRRERDDNVPRPAQHAAFDRRAVGQEVQRQEQQDDRHHLDRQLGHRQVRRAEEDETGRDDQPDDADQDQRQQAVAVQEDKAAGRRDQHQPARDLHGIRRLQRAARRAHRAGGPSVIAHAHDGHRHHGGIAREGPIVQPQRYRLRQADRGRDDPVKDTLGLGPGCGIPDAQQRGEERQQDQPAHDRDDRHIKRRTQPVPDFEMRRRHLGCVAEDRGGHQLDERLGQKRREADHHHGDDQQRWRQPQAGLGIMRMVGIVVAFLAKESMADQPETIGRREERAKGRQRGHQPRQIEKRGVQRLFQHHLFRQEAIEQRDPRHRKRRQRGDHEGHRHQMPQPAQTPDVARMHRVIHDPRRHEKRRLEGRVVQDVKHRRQRAKGRASAQEHGDQTKVADGRESQERLQVMFEQRDHRAQHHGDQPRRGDDDEPLRRARKHRPHPRHQEDPRLHHRGGVQIGRDRRGRGHGMGQPEVEWELRGFGETAQQDQDQRRQIERRGLDRLAVFQDHAQVIAADDLTQQQHATDHRKPAHAGHGQRHPRALAAFGQMLPIADQQEGRQRGKLPEN